MSLVIAGIGAGAGRGGRHGGWGSKDSDEARAGETAKGGEAGNGRRLDRAEEPAQQARRRGEGGGRQADGRTACVCVCVRVRDSETQEVADHRQVPRRSWISELA